VSRHHAQRKVSYLVVCRLSIKGRNRSNRRCGFGGGGAARTTDRRYQFITSLCDLQKRILYYHISVSYPILRYSSKYRQYVESFQCIHIQILYSTICAQGGHHCRFCPHLLCFGQEIWEIRLLTQSAICNLHAFFIDASVISSTHRFRGSFNISNSVRWSSTTCEATTQENVAIGKDSFKSCP
jgi:hypothetical protein